MTHRRVIITSAAVVVLLVLTASLARRRSDAPQHAGAAGASAGARPLDSTCRAMWEEGFELDGVVGGRESQAYFDMWPAPGRGEHERVSGIVIVRDAQSRAVLADAAIGLNGLPGDDDCDVQFQDRRDEEGSVWLVRIEGTAHVTGTRRLADSRTEPLAFTIVPETACDGAGEWRTFSHPDWPVRFDYPAGWTLTADHDDVNIECPSATRLAVGGAYLTFERGQFNDPYWFVRRAGDDWRVNGLGCDPQAPPGQPDPCYPARRSQRNGMTVLQAAAGEHRRYRPGVGYLGQGRGIVRYLWVLGDRWVSLDSTEWSHYDDLGVAGGPVLFDGDTAGDRIVRSVRPR
jgi:hypothetical protein